MAEPTAMARLPQELWDKIIEYLLPSREITIEDWPDFEDEGAKTKLPILEFAQDENPGLERAMQALAYSNDLLFPDSHTLYWRMCIRHATWRIQHFRNVRKHRYSVDYLKSLEKQFNDEIRHVIAVIGGEQVQSFATTDECVEETLETANWIVGGFNGLITLTIRIDINSPKPERRRWLHNVAFYQVFSQSLDHEAFLRPLGESREHWREWGLEDFKVLVRTTKVSEVSESESIAIENRDGEEPPSVLEEDVSGVWTGLETHLNDYYYDHFRGRPSRWRIEQLLDELDKRSLLGWAAERSPWV